MSVFFPYSSSVSSPLYSYSPEVIVSIDNEKNIIRNNKVVIESIPVTSNYYLPNNVLNTSIFYPQTYSYPVFQNISYIDVNQDYDLQKKVSKHFYSQLYNKWVPELYPSLLNYLKVSQNDVHLVKSISEAKSNTTKESEIGTKINYLADYILTKKNIVELLSVYSDNKGVKWWNMRAYADDIELYMIKRLEKKLKEMVLE
jgi:hypothetical protein